MGCIFNDFWILSQRSKNNIKNELTDANAETALSIWQALQMQNVNEYLGLTDISLFIALKAFI